MRVALGKVAGVEAVTVSLERGISEVRLRPNNTVTLPQLRQIVKNNGFNAGDATVTAVGSLVQRGGTPAFEVTGTSAVWPLMPDSSHRPAYDDAAGRARTRPGMAAEIVGVVPAPRSAAETDRILVQRLTPHTK